MELNIFPSLVSLCIVKLVKMQQLPAVSICGFDVRYQLVNIIKNKFIKMAKMPNYTIYDKNVCLFSNHLLYSIFEDSLIDQIYLTDRLSLYNLIECERLNRALSCYLEKLFGDVYILILFDLDLYYSSQHTDDFTDRVSAFLYDKVKNTLLFIAGIKRDSFYRTFNEVEVFIFGFKEQPKIVPIEDFTAI